MNDPSMSSSQSSSWIYPINNNNSNNENVDNYNDNYNDNHDNVNDLMGILPSSSSSSSPMNHETTTTTTPSSSPMMIRTTTLSPPPPLPSNLPTTFSHSSFLVHYDDENIEDEYDDDNDNNNNNFNGFDNFNNSSYNYNNDDDDIDNNVDNNFLGRPLSSSIPMSFKMPTTTNNNNVITNLPKLRSSLRLNTSQEHNLNNHRHVAFRSLSLSNNSSPVPLVSTQEDDILLYLDFHDEISILLRTWKVIFGMIAFCDFIGAIATDYYHEHYNEFYAPTTISTIKPYFTIAIIDVSKHLVTNISQNILYGIHNTTSWIHNNLNHTSSLYEQHNDVYDYYYNQEWKIHRLLLLFDHISLYYPNLINTLSNTFHKMIVWLYNNALLFNILFSIVWLFDEFIRSYQRRIYQLKQQKDESSLLPSLSSRVLSSSSSFQTTKKISFNLLPIEHHLSLLPSESERGHRIRRVSSISQMPNSSNRTKTTSRRSWRTIMSEIIPSIKINLWRIWNSEYFYFTSFLLLHASLLPIGFYYYWLKSIHDHSHHIPDTLHLGYYHYNNQCQQAPGITTGGGGGGYGGSFMHNPNNQCVIADDPSSSSLSSVSKWWSSSIGVYTVPTSMSVILALIGYQNYFFMNKYVKPIYRYITINGKAFAIERIKRWILKNIHQPFKLWRKILSILRIIRWIQYLSPVLGKLPVLYDNAIDLYKRYIQHKHSIIAQKVRFQFRKKLTGEQLREYSIILIQKTYRTHIQCKKYHLLTKFTGQKQNDAAIRVQVAFRNALRRARLRIELKQLQLKKLHQKLFNADNYQNNNSNNNINNDNNSINSNNSSNKNEQFNDTEYLRMYILEKEISYYLNDKLLLRPNTKLAITWRATVVFAILLEMFTTMILVPMIIRYYTNPMIAQQKGGQQIKQVPINLISVEETLEKYFTPTPVLTLPQCQWNHRNKKKIWYQLFDWKHPFASIISIVTSMISIIQSFIMQSSSSSSSSLSSIHHHHPLPWYCTKWYAAIQSIYAATIQLSVPNLLEFVGFICYVDVFVVFFTGMYNNTNGLLQPKHFIERWIIPGIVFQLSVNPLMSNTSKVCMYIVEQIFFHYGPIRVVRWTSAFIIPILLIIATKLKSFWTHIVTEQNKNTISYDGINIPLLPDTSNVSLSRIKSNKSMGFLGQFVTIPKPQSIKHERRHSTV